MKQTRMSEKLNLPEPAAKKYVFRTIRTASEVTPMSNRFPAGLAISVLALAMAFPAHAQSAKNIDFGTNAGEWVDDGECDDPRFEGPGMAEQLVENDRMRDANDCAALFSAGQISLRSTQITKGFDFGDDSSEWANDGECDDPRFEGPGAALVLLEEDLGKDASDCRTLLGTGQISLSPGGGATRINFGDNTSEWANDGECDDPRFTGPGMASTLVEADRGRDANDCSTLFFNDKIELGE